MRCFVWENPVPDPCLWRWPASTAVSPPGLPSSKPLLSGQNSNYKKKVARLSRTGGLDEKALLRQLRQIDRLNATSAGLHLLKGVEVDILPDGSLDLDDQVLSRLDVVVAAIHSRLEMDQATMTNRICSALRNPYLNLPAHPTGRVLSRRRESYLDMERGLAAARAERVAVEINSNPKRLDLSDAPCRLALDLGVRLAINSDAHTRNTLSRISYGVGVARRGWLGWAQVINTQALDRLMGTLRKERY